MAESYTIDLFTQEWVVNNLFSAAVVFSTLTLAKRAQATRVDQLLSFMSGVLFVSFIYENVFYNVNDNWTLQNNLPLHLCGISSLICMFFPLIKNKKPWLEFVFYSGIIGGFQSLFTPQMNHYDGNPIMYLLYYVDHLSIIIIPLIMYFHLKIELGLFSWLKALLWLNILAGLIMPLNFYLDANYMYLNRPPDVDNPFIIGQWPYYILNLEVVALLLFSGLFFGLRALFRTLNPKG